VSYQITTLGERIDDAGGRLIEAHYPEMMTHWEAHINHALADHH